ncbi:hypothetical protein CATYP_04725 [Corynebacterium atypicum]|uniref:Metallo-beta-lactamase domain-containing protein n=1 Tax=Corynebacterium atypicum TaxID=191610 RepID=A0ABN4DFF1_9CORY|nr:MBL fold metallo-hydrolase [Corynebacterium atypicum]AIG64056.1 hypothetical protein CATYP_04725 [Corynebacterium atypicum]
MEIRGFAAGPFQTNCYLLQGEGASRGACAIIDPGLGAARVVDEYLQDTGQTLEAIVLSHGHIDHTRDAGELAEATGAPVYIHPADAFILEEGQGVFPEMLEPFQVADMVPVGTTRPLADAAQITLAGAQFQVRHAPGHSPGSVLLVGEKVVFSGDVVFRGAIGRTDLPFSDPEQMKNTLAGPVAELPATLPVLPGHGPGTTMSAERRSNPYLAPFLR